MLSHLPGTNRLAITCVAGLMLLLAACSASTTLSESEAADSPAAQPAQAADSTSEAPSTNDDAVAAPASADGDPEALLASPVMGDFWREGPFEDTVCTPVDPPEITDAKSEWDCEIADSLFGATVVVDLNDRTYVRRGQLPQSARTIYIEFALDDMVTDYGYDIEISSYACSSRAFGDGTSEFRCSGNLIGSDEPVSFLLLIADASLEADSPYEIVDVVGP